MISKCVCVWINKQFTLLGVVVGVIIILSEEYFHPDRYYLGISHE